MSVITGRVPLLGKLIAAGFGGGRVEVTATFALTALLEDEAVARRFTAWLADRADVGLPQHLRYRPEAPVGTGRVDVAGYDAEDMRVVCEAKFGAPLTAGQLTYYAAAHPAALLVVLVPEPRRVEAERVLRQALVELPDMPALVLTWDEVGEALADADTDAGDVEQFRALCEVAQGFDVAPLREEDLGAGRQQRLPDFHRITDQVTVGLHQLLGTGHVLPVQAGGDNYSRYRYLAPTDSDGVCFALGVRSFEAGPASPLWLRWHRATGSYPHGIDAIAEALSRAGIFYTRDDGHVWAPVHPELHVGCQRLVTGLVEQIMTIHAATLPAMADAR